MYVTYKLCPSSRFQFTLHELGMNIVLLSSLNVTKLKKGQKVVNALKFLFPSIKPQNPEHLSIGRGSPRSNSPFCYTKFDPLFLG